MNTIVRLPPSAYRLYGTVVRQTRSRVVISLDDDIDPADLRQAIRTRGQGDPCCWRLDKSVSNESYKRCLNAIRSLEQFATNEERSNLTEGLNERAVRAIIVSDDSAFLQRRLDFVRKNVRETAAQGNDDVDTSQGGARAAMTSAEYAELEDMDDDDERHNPVSRYAVAKARRTGAIAAPAPADDASRPLPIASEIVTACVNQWAKLPPAWAKNKGWRTDAGLALKELAESGTLNYSQRLSVGEALTRSFTLWQGPPGTGKTRTLLALIEVLVRASSGTDSRWRTMGPVLACADTNAAVDNLAEGLRQRGILVTRVGRPTKIRASVLPFTVDAIAERTPEGERAVQIRERAAQLLQEADDLERSVRARLRAAGDRAPPSLSSSNRRDADMIKHLRGEARNLRKMSREMLRGAKEAALRDSQVICCTCSGAADALLQGWTFKAVVLDEATQATEPSSLVPLVKGAQYVVLAGDQKQLPPTVLSQAAAHAGLGETLFERLISIGLDYTLLDTQYRMHPDIMRFPSDSFYDGRLKCGVDAALRPPPRGFPWPTPGVPMALVAVEGTAAREQRDSTSSFANAAEARAAILAGLLLARGGDVTSVAFLTPYAGQVRALSEAMRAREGEFERLGVRVRSVSSVDGFQGREADVVVYSTVRNNAEGTIGFVSDARRLNVAITRPKKGLVRRAREGADGSCLILGNLHALCDVLRFASLPALHCTAMHVPDSSYAFFSPLIICSVGDRRLALDTGGEERTVGRICEVPGPDHRAAPDRPGFGAGGGKICVGPGIRGGAGPREDGRRRRRAPRATDRSESCEGGRRASRLDHWRREGRERRRRGRWFPAGATCAKGDARPEDGWGLVNRLCSYIMGARGMYSGTKGEKRRMYNKLKVQGIQISKKSSILRLFNTPL